MLVAAGEMTNPAMRRAQADFAAAKASIGVANALPPFGVALDFQKAVTNGGVNPWTYGFTVDWPIELWGKRPTMAFQATMESNVAALAISKTRWELRTAVTKATVDLHAARVRLEAIGKMSGVLTQWELALGKSRALGETGRIEELTVARERSTYERDEADALRQMKVAEAALGKSLGVPLNEVDGIVLRPLPDGLPSVSPLAHWEKEAALKRPDVLEGLANYAVTDAALRLEILNQYPDVRLNSGLSFDQGQTKWLLGPAVSVLPDLNRAGIAKARANREANAAAFQVIQTTALTDVSSAWADYRGSLGQLEKSRSLVEKSRNIASSQEELMKLGEGSRLTVYQNQYLEGQDEAAAVAARFQVWQTLVILQDAARSDILPEIF